MAYARIVVVKAAESESRETAERIAEQIYRFVTEQPGFRSIQFLANEAINEYSTFSVWDSKEDLEAYLTRAQDMQAAVAAFASEEVFSRTFEVHEPEN